MKKKGNRPTERKIVFDEKTAEPIIIDVEEPSNEVDRLKKTVEIVENHPLTKASDDAREVSKHIMMTRLPGFDDESKRIDKRQRAFKRAFTVFFVVFVVGVLAYTFYKDFFASGRDAINWENLKEVLQTSWLYLLLAFIALGLCYVFKGLKLSILCKASTGKFHLKTCFETGIVGHYYNCITPLGAGGQPFEIYHLAKHGVHGGAAAALPIASFFMNQFAFVGLGVAALVTFNHNSFNLPLDIYQKVQTPYSVIAIIGLLCCLLMPTLVVMFSMLPKVGIKLVHFVMWLGGKLRIVKNPKETTYKTVKSVVSNAKCLKTFAKKPLAFLLCMLVSLLEWMSLCSIAYFCLKTFGFEFPGSSLPLEWVQVFQLVIIVYAAISFIPTPGNSGAADLIFFTLFSAQLLAGFAFTAMFFWRMLSFYAFIVIGFIFTSVRKRIDKKRATASAELDGTFTAENSTESPSEDK